MAFRNSPLPSIGQSDSLLFAAAQVRELDRRAIEEFGIAGISLMKRAGQALYDLLEDLWPDRGHLTIFCGPGNNGGDGYVVAGLAARAKLPVLLIETAPDKLKGDALRARHFALQMGVEPISADIWLKKPLFAETSVIVDALLGTGFSGELRAPFAQLVKQISQSGLPVIAADIPSGLEADTGFVVGQAVRADCTITFIGNKPGLYTGSGRAHSGQIHFANLDVPAEVYAGVSPQVRLLDLDTELAKLPPRSADAHKGDHGHVLVIGGDLGFAGAPLMAAEAAARMGAGLVSVATRPEQIAAIVGARPEIMAFDAISPAFDAVLERATVLVVGPGLGQNAWGQRLLQKALAAKKPMVLDADALNLIASRQLGKITLNADTLITPHPGEAGRLLKKATEVVNRNRLVAVNDLAQRYKCAVLLKGSGTLVKADGEVSLCPYGNPGMGSGGMGDVLSGILGGLMAQGLTAGRAAALGSCLHAAAADILAAVEGQRGMLATDLIAEARALLNAMELDEPEQDG